jgi:hypothetical protein
VVPQNERVPVGGVVLLRPSDIVEQNVRVARVGLAQIDDFLQLVLFHVVTLAVPVFANAVELGHDVDVGSRADGCHLSQVCLSSI